MADFVTAAANNMVTMAYAATPTVRHALNQIHVAYNSAPTGGLLEIQSSGSTIYTIPITAAGPAPIYFNPPLYGVQGGDLTCRLYPGGASATGYMNLWHIAV